MYGSHKVQADICSITITHLVHQRKSFLPTPTQYRKFQGCGAYWGSNEQFLNIPSLLYFLLNLHLSVFSHSNRLIMVLLTKNYYKSLIIIVIIIIKRPGGTNSISQIIVDYLLTYCEETRWSTENMCLTQGLCTTALQLHNNSQSFCVLWINSINLSGPWPWPPLRRQWLIIDRFRRRW